MFELFTYIAFEIGALILFRGGCGPCAQLQPAASPRTACFALGKALSGLALCWAVESGRVMETAMSQRVQPSTRCSERDAMHWVEELLPDGQPDDFQIAGSLS